MPPRWQSGTIEIHRCGVPAHFVKQAVHVVLGQLDALHEIHRLAVAFDLQFQHFGTGLNPLQCVAALVSQSGAHLSNAGQSFGLQGPLLGLIQVRDVLSDRQHRHGPAIHILERLAGPADAAFAPRVRHDRADRATGFRPLHRFAKDLAHAFSLALRYERFQPTLALHLLLQDAGQFLHVGVVAQDVALHVQHQHDGLGMFQQSLRELLFLVQGVFHPCPFGHLESPHMLAFVRIFDDGQVQVEQLVECADGINQLAASWPAQCSHKTAVMPLRRREMAALVYTWSRPITTCRRPTCERCST